MLHTLLRRSLPLLLVSLLVVVATATDLIAQEANRSPFFPELGDKAYRQYVNDLGGTASIMAIALRPGEEDLTTLAYYRLALGVRISLVYVTNGESLPDGGAPDDIVHTAARRKEEATAVADFLDFEPRFLNLPDPGVTVDAGELRQLWPSDTLVKRLRDAVSLEAPDVVILNDQSLWTRDASVVGPYLERAVREIEGEQEPHSHSGAPASTEAEVSIQRIFSDSRRSEPSSVIPQGARNAIFNKSYAEIAYEAEEAYKSLATLHLERSPRIYGLISSGTNPRGPSLISGIELPSEGMRSLARQIEDFSAFAVAHKGRTILSRLANLISTLDLAIRTQANTFTVGERRLLARWNHTLEDLRCNVLDVSLHVTSHEPVISKMQLFRISFDHFHSSTTGGTTQIYFPQKTPNWIVNTSVQKVFPFKSPSEYKILSQEDVQYDIPTSEYGLTAPALGTDLLYAIVHHGKTREENFIYQRSIRFRVGPKRSFELMNFVVGTLPPVWVAFKAVNYSRDAGEGIVGTADSIYQPVTREFTLPSLYSVVQDTLELHLAKRLATGTYRSLLRTPGNFFHPLLVRSFECKVDTGVKVGLLTEYPNGTLAWSLRRLGVNWRLLRPSDNSLGLRALQVIVVDEGVVSTKSCSPTVQDSIASWVRTGGRLLVLSQLGVSGTRTLFGERNPFALGSAMSIGENPLVDSTTTVINTPNLLGEDDWRNWIFAKAFGTIELSDPANEILVRNPKREPVVATRHVGKGSETFVALNLDRQLSEAVPGAYRILANLLGSR